MGILSSNSGYHLNTVFNFSIITKMISKSQKPICINNKEDGVQELPKLYKTNVVLI